MIFLDCPECQGPLEVTEQFEIDSFQCARLACLYGHLFIAHADWLAEQGIILNPPSDSLPFQFSADPQLLWEWLNKFYE